MVACVRPGAVLASLQAGTSEVTIQQNGEAYEAGIVAGDGTYQASAPYWDPGNNILQLNIGESALYTCTCPAGCVYSGISTPTIGLHYFLIEARDPWFQVQGGNVAALQPTGSAIRNFISDKCIEDSECRPFLITRINNESFSSGAVVTGGGTVDLQYIPGEQTNNTDEDGRNMVAIVDRKVAQERYEYFLRLFNFPENPVSDFSLTADAAAKPVLPPLNSAAGAYYHQGDIHITEEWNVNAGESVVVFVDGSVTISNEIHTAVGGFLAFFASGDITINPNVELTDLTATSSLVEGVFVANGQIIIASRGPEAGGDGKFIGAGTFVGWQGLVFERDYDDYAGRKVENNHKPTEVFQYRPDFLLTVPEQIKTPRYTWREVAP